MPRYSSRCQIHIVFLFLLPLGHPWGPLQPEPEFTIGEIRVDPRNVFEESEYKVDRWLFRLVNRMHHTTRPETVRGHLLFETGDRYSPRLLEESERLLRATRYLQDVEIRPSQGRDNRIDVDVITKDVWTLDVGASVERSGGENSLRLELQETNFLGTGRGLLLRHQSSVDRSSTLLRYNDDRFLGSRARLLAMVAESSDGGSLALDFERPFYSLDSRWAAGIRLFEDERTESLYRLGEIREQFRHQTSEFEIYGGLSRGLVQGRAHRWIAGFTYREDRFGPAADASLTPPIARDRVLAYPWIELHSIQDRYVEAQDMDQISRTEDLHLGQSYRLRLGLSSPWLGSDRTGAVFDLSGSSGLEPAPDQTLLLRAKGTGRWGAEGAENLLIHGGVKYFWRDFGRHLFVGSLDAHVARNLDAENQLLLGGDSGLRGYPLRYQEGERRLLLTLEQRFFTGWYPFKLLHVGAAVFFDAGRTWSDAPPDATQLGWLKDVGVGLRLSPSRTGLGKMIHFDVALPLDGDESISSVQWLIRTKASF